MTQIIEEVELFRIVLGPEQSLQSAFVTTAIQNVLTKTHLGGRTIKTEYFTIAQVISLKLTEAEFLSWCRQAKYLLFCSHPLQNDFGPKWDHIKFGEGLREMAREKGRKVFPPAEAMHAAFMQDKNEVYDTLKEFMLPTFTIRRPTGPTETVSGLDETTLSELYDFCSKNYEIHGSHVGGWYAKLTATTGNKGNDSTTKLDDVGSVVISLFNRDNMEYKPTIAVQATVSYTKEHKYYVLTNRHRNKEDEPVLAHNPKSGTGRSFRENPHILEFVKRAKRKYEEVYGPDSTSPVFRCDVFQRQDGRIVINEIEHFEAQILSDAKNESYWRAFLYEFWEDQILYMLSDC